MGILKSYYQKPIIIIFFLGFSSGIPLALIVSTLKAFLVDKNIDIAVIGFFTLISLPYGLKFLWAPIIDSVNLPYLSRLGKRRSWIILTQFLLLFLIAFLGTLSDFSSLISIAAISVLIAFVSASQDIVVDAYRIESVKAENQAIAASMYIYGYRIGLLISGALALALSDKISWNLVFYFVSTSMLVGIFACLIADESVGKSADEKDKKEFHFKTWFQNSVVEPFKDFANRPRWYLILAFVLCFKLTDAFAGNLFLPFLLEIDFSRIQIAGIVKTFGLFATLFGALLGGILVKKVGIMKGLWIAAILQIISNFGFYYLSLVGNDINALYFVIFVENLSGGIGDVILVAYLSGLCNFKFTATQYSLLVSVASSARIFLSSPAGIISSSYGWSVFFLASIFLGLPCLILLFLLNRVGKKLVAK